MDVVFARCAGSEGQKRTVVVCRLTADAEGQLVAQTPTVGTPTGDLLHLSDWLADGGCTPSHVGLESTGAYGKPVDNPRAGTFTVWLLTAQPSKAVPGRKTEVKDAHWIADPARATGSCARASSRPGRSGSGAI